MAYLQGKKPISLPWMLFSLLATSPFGLFFLYLGKPGSARAAWLLAGMIVIAAKIRWELRSRFWFWPTIILISLAHVIAVVAIPWTSKWIPAALMFPVCAADCVIILGILQFLEKSMPPSSLKH